MSTLTKLVLGAMGRLRPEPAQGQAVATIVLPPPDRAAIADALGLTRDQQVVLSQTVGRPRR